MWSFILDLYRLKWEPRRGWLLRELQPEFWEGRIESLRMKKTQNQIQIPQMFFKI